MQDFILFYLFIIALLSLVDCGQNKMAVQTLHAALALQPGNRTPACSQEGAHSVTLDLHSKYQL